MGSFEGEILADEQGADSACEEASLGSLTTDLV